jgi:hypothetical protein
VRVEMERVADEIGVPPLRTSFIASLRAICDPVPSERRPEVTGIGFSAQSSRSRPISVEKSAAPRATARALLLPPSTPFHR